MSIKPKFGFDILRGVKRVELRGFVAPIESGDLVILYLSSPVKALCGEFTVGRVVYGLDGIRRIVEEYEEVSGSGVGCEDWLYVAGRRRPMGIEVLNPVEYPFRFTLDDLRREIPGFKPPLSYRVVRSWEPLYKLLVKIRGLAGVL